MMVEATVIDVRGDTYHCPLWIDPRGFRINMADWHTFHGRILIQTEVAPARQRRYWPELCLHIQTGMVVAR